MFDIIIIGSGPAGLTAAIYARRNNKSVLVIEKETFGGEITHSPKVENYPGYNAISGAKLGELLVEQALALGAELEMDNITHIEKTNGIFTLKGEYSEYEGKSVIIASGSKPRRLGLINEEKLVGNGVSYCAVCDGPFYKNKDVAVIGGGNSALVAAVMLCDYCKSVTVVQNLAFLTGEQSLIDSINEKENARIVYNSRVVALNGEDALSSITVKNDVDSSETEINLDAVFVAIGQVPENEAFKDLCDIDKFGYIISDEACNTKTSGLFVAGDCRTKSIRQVVTASSDGATAAISACNYLRNI